VGYEQAMKPVNVPEYDFALHQRSSHFRRVEPADVVIMEGIMVLHMPEVRDLLHMKIYVDTDDDVRLARRCAWLPQSLPRLPDSDFVPV
jgi:uridine kinase